MAYSKVILNGVTLMDVTQKTVEANKLLEGYTALKNDGTSITGTYEPQSVELQAKSNINPTTASQTITPDTGYDGLSSVQINAMPSGSATTPATTITANPTISVSASGLVTASVSKSQGVTPTVSAGYVSSGTSGTITVNGSNTSQLTVYNGEHHQPTPSSYTVTVSLTNPVNPSAFSSIDVMLVSSNSEQSVIRYLEQINSPTGSKVYEVEPSAYGILIFPHGASPTMGTSSCTGDVTLASDLGYLAIYHVTGNGTITIDGIDYDD